MLIDIQSIELRGQLIMQDISASMVKNYLDFCSIVSSLTVATIGALALILIALILLEKTFDKALITFRVKQEFLVWYCERLKQRK